MASHWRQAYTCAPAGRRSKKALSSKPLVAAACAAPERNERRLAVAVTGPRQSWFHGPAAANQLTVGIRVSLIGNGHQNGLTL